MTTANVSSGAILRTIEKHRKEVGRYGVKRLGLFGSAARGEAHKGSDLDFVVEFKRKTFDNYMDLKFYLEDLFHRKVVLVITGAIKPPMRSAILREVRYAQGL